MMGGLLFEGVVVHVRSDAGRRLQFKSDRVRRADRVDPATKLTAGARGCVVVVLEKGALLDLRHRVHGDVLARPRQAAGQRWELRRFDEDARVDRAYDELDRRRGPGPDDLRRHLTRTAGA